MKLTLIPLVLGVALAQAPDRPPNRPPQPPRPMHAQPQPMMQPGQDLAGLKTYLNLSDDQVRQIRRAGEQARKDAEEKMRTNEPQIREKRMALEDLLAKGTNDAAAVGRLMIDIRALEKQMRDAQQSVRTSQLNVLTPEQKTKFRSIEEAASLPQATREAMRMGLVQGPPQQPQPDQPRPARQQPQPRRGPGPGEAPQER